MKVEKNFHFAEPQQSGIGREFAPPNRSLERRKMGKSESHGSAMSPL